MISLLWRGWFWSGGWLPLVGGGDCVLLPLVKGGVYVEIPQVWGDWFVLAKCLPLLCEVVFVLVCALPLVRGYIGWERSIVFAQILSGGSLCGKSCVDELVEILLCEGGDVELYARTSKHISVFAIDPLSLTLSLLFCALHWFILSYHTYMLCCVCLCASLVLNHESFI